MVLAEVSLLHGMCQGRAGVTPAAWQHPIWEFGSFSGFVGPSGLGCRAYCIGLGVWEKVQVETFEHSLLCAQSLTNAQTLQESLESSEGGGGPSTAWRHGGGNGHSRAGVFLHLFLSFLHRFPSFFISFCFFAYFLSCFLAFFLCLHFFFLSLSLSPSFSRVLSFSILSA